MQAEAKVRPLNEKQSNLTVFKFYDFKKTRFLYLNFFESKFTRKGCDFEINILINKQFIIVNNILLVKKKMN